MPTGYTADIEKGISFEEFIMACARNFGALITMRDAPNDEEIPDEFKPSDYNKDQLSETEAELKRLRSIGSAEANKEAEKEYRKALADNEKGIRKANELEGKYREMLAKAKAWIPPSPDHQGLKDFMVSQIEKSIRFDCGTEYYIKNTPVRKKGAEWLQEKIQGCLKDIDYHSKKYQKEVERCAGRTDWVQKLRASIVHIPTGKDNIK